MDHREVGYHHTVLTRADNSVVREWDERLERELLPNDPDMMDLNLRITNRLGLRHIRKIWQSRAVAVVRFVRDEAEQDLLAARLAEMSDEERLGTAVVIARRLQPRVSLAPLTLLSPGMFELAEDEEDLEVSRDSLVLSVLAELATAGEKVLSLPVTVGLEELGGLERLLAQPGQANILAGRLGNRKHPQLGTVILTPLPSHPHLTSPSIKFCIPTVSLGKI